LANFTDLRKKKIEMVVPWPRFWLKERSMFEGIRYNHLILEVLVIMVLVVINGVLAMSGIALVKSRKIRLRQMAAGPG
jgi:hypothetical protein